MAGDSSASSPKSRLSPLQQDLLLAFFERERRFFLTGGGALAGFYFGHRETEDLDFFSPPGPDLAEAGRALEEASRACGAAAREERTFQDFRRYAVTRGSESCLVDLVIDRAPAIEPNKPVRGTVRLDTLEEIAANKLSALLGRAEIKDLVDLQWLLDAGVDLARALADAERKDAGADPATLAWVLGDVHIGAAAPVPAGLDPAALDAFRKDVVRRLEILAFERARKE